MPQAAVAAYLERLPRLQAETKMLIYEAVRVPYLERGAREQVLRLWQRMIAPQNSEQAPRVTRAILQAYGIGVRVPEDNDDV